MAHVRVVSGRGKGEEYGKKGKYELGTAHVIWSYP